MTGMRGTELAQELVGLKPALRVLLVSGYNPDDGQPGQGGISEPLAHDLLRKPYTPEQLGGKVRQALDR